MCYGANLASHYADGHPLATAASGKKGGGIFTCTNCGFTWTRGRRRALVAMGPCPGTYVWKINMPAYLDLPWRYPRAAALMWRGHEIHPTHNLTFYRVCIFCLACGARSATGAPRTLCHPCELKPASGKTAQRLRRMKEGYWYPSDPPGDWPEDHHTQCPNGLVYWMD